MKRFTTLLCAALLALTIMPGLAFAKDFTIGLILVGPYNDKGYSQAQYEGCKYVEATCPAPR